MGINCSYYFTLHHRKEFWGKDNNNGAQTTIQAIVQSTQQAIIASPISTMSKNFVSVTVLSNVEWQNSKINILAGDIVTISAQGTWNHGTANPENERYDANGYHIKYSNTILPNVNAGAIIGRIENCDPFLIGTKLTFTATCTGVLYLIMNDVLGQFGNNIGNSMSESKSILLLHQIQRTH